MKIKEKIRRKISSKISNKLPDPNNYDKYQDYVSDCIKKGATMKECGNKWSKEKK